MKFAHISDTHIKNLKYHYEYRVVFEQLYEKLKQEIEMLKMCARYKDLDLGPNFPTVREMCKDVRPPKQKAE